jgi:hypothetical protein
MTRKMMLIQYIESQKENEFLSSAAIFCVGHTIFD